jgi:murein DD-endopeptidase MepM/ murein hydrolase activator NlpD
MGHTDRSSYDDMGRTENNKRRRSDRMDSRSLRIIAAVVIVGILLCVGVVVLWLLYFSASAEETAPAKPENVLVVEPETEPTIAPLAEPAAEAAPSAVTEDTEQVSSDVAPAPRSGWYVEHVVQPDETLASISADYGISRETLLSVNTIRNLSSIQAGTVLRIPKIEGQLYTVQSGDSLSIITNRFNPTLGWKTLQEINELNSEVIYPGQKLFIPSAQVDDDGSLAAYDRFVRPAEGRITGLYGQTVVYGNTEDIVVLQGIWISGALGTAVEASATGVVVDAGNVIDGMGRFVVLSHDNSYRTTYAHLEDVSVKVGDAVKQGDIIGTIGNSGVIETPTLYFSIEQDGTALNPANFF